MKSIFVSSTFKDMHEERDILHKRVIPELSEYAAQYGESVSLCDLRWGVNTEDLDSEEGSRKVLSVCLDEIDRCRPYMIVLLGERYGWIPEPETLQEIEKTRAGMSLKDLEKSVTALEIEYGALENKEQLEHTLFYFREFEGSEPEKYGCEDALHERKLSELKKRIRNLTGDRVHTYTVSWDAEKNTLKGLEHFAEQVTEDLKKLLEEEWKEYALLTPFERDQRLQWDFARQKSDQFRAREGVINQYLNKLNQGQNLLAISGASGSGKSTLIGRLAVRLQEEGKNVLPIFCGSTMFCNGAMDVIRYIVRYIEDYFSLEHYEEKKERDIEELAFRDETRHRENRTDTDRWTDRLAEMCALYAEKSDRELVILIDALDQLFPDETRDGLCFIPTNLSGKVKIVCSFLDNFDMGYHKKWEQAEQLLPLDETDKKAVVDGILHSHQERELPLSVIEKIMTKNGSDNPLYLSLVVRRLAMMDRYDYEKMTSTEDEIDSITAYEMAVVDELPENLEELCMHLMYVASEKLGTNMTELAVRYIAVSRYGLRETDLEGILTDQEIEWNSLDFTLFLRYMKSFFLLRDDGRLDFTHQSLRMGVLKNVVNEKELHRQILEYLKKLDKYDEVRISEIIYQCYGADDRKYFVQYINEYESTKEIIGPVVKVVSEMTKLDGGEWLYQVIQNAISYGAEHNFVTFLNFEMDEGFAGSQRKLRDETLKVAKMLVEKKRTRTSLEDLSNSYKKAGDILLKMEEERSLWDVERMYENSLKIKNELVIKRKNNRNLRRLSSSYQNLAEVLIKKGDKKKLEIALECSKKSLKISEELVSKEGTIENWHNLSENYLRIARILVEQGGKEKKNEAIEMCIKGLEIDKELAIKKKSEINLVFLGFTYIKVGDILNRGDVKENAQKMYEKSLEIFKDLVEKDRNIKYIIYLGFSYERLGGILEEQGGKENCKKAVEIYNKIQGVYKGLVSKEEIYENLQDLSSCFEWAGKILYRCGRQKNLEMAQIMYEKNLEIVEKMAGQERTSLNLLHLSIIYEWLGRIYTKQGEEEKLRIAREMYKKSMEIREELAAKEGTTEAKRTLEDAYIRIGGLVKNIFRKSLREIFEKEDINRKQERQVSLEIARKMFERSLEIEKELVLREKNSLSLYRLSRRYSDLGYIYVEQGGEENMRIARKMYARSLEIAGNDEDLIGLSIRYGQVGEIFSRKGGEKNLSFAREMYEKRAELDENRAMKEGSNRSLAHLSFSYEQVGDICIEQDNKDNLKTACDMYMKSVEVQEKLVGKEETRRNLRELVYKYEKLRNNLMEQGGEDNLILAREINKKRTEVKKTLNMMEASSDNS